MDVRSVWWWIRTIVAVFLSLDIDLGCKRIIILINNTIISLMLYIYIL